MQLLTFVAHKACVSVARAVYPAVLFDVKSAIGQCACAGLQSFVAQARVVIQNTHYILFIEKMTNDYLLQIPLGDKGVYGQETIFVANGALLSASTLWSCLLVLRHVLVLCASDEAKACAFAKSILAPSFRSTTLFAQNLFAPVVTASMQCQQSCQSDTNAQT